MGLLDASFDLGTFGELAGEVAGLLSGDGFEVAANLLLVAASAYAGNRAGRLLLRCGMPAALAAAAVAGWLFLDGAPASYFVVNAGTSYLGFLFPVWREARSLADAWARG